MPRVNSRLSQAQLNYRKKKIKYIGEQIVKKRLELGFTQEDLREKLEQSNAPISRSTLSRIERGKSLPDPIQMLELSEVLQTTISYFVGEE